MISVITVNYKTIDYTLRMLESLYTHHVKGGLEVFVIENGSGDDLNPLRERFPQVNVIESQTNLGFAGGCNIGIKQAKGDYIVLINPDIEFVDEALYKIYDRMDQDSNVGIGGASLKNMDGTQQDCVWRFPTPADQLFLLLKLNHLFPHHRFMRRWLEKDFSYSKTQDVDQVMGAFFCIRRELIKQIGLLDDGFFMWYEEVDFCKRARDAGWSIRYYHDVGAKHKKGSSFDRVPTVKKQAMLRKSIRRYARKHFSPVAGFLFWVGEPIFFIMSLLASLVKPI
jgi:GT2 family glycosyltransferase